MKHVVVTFFKRELLKQRMTIFEIMTIRWRPKRFDNVFYSCAHLKKDCHGWVFPCMLKVLANTTCERKGSSVTDTIITLNEQTLKNQLGRVSVEETLNKMLDAEADQLANAKRYERTD